MDISILLDGVESKSALTELLYLADDLGIDRDEMSLSDVADAVEMANESELESLLSQPVVLVCFVRRENDTRDTASSTGSVIVERRYAEDVARSLDCWGQSNRTGDFRAASGRGVTLRYADGFTREVVTND